jgi:hypothetical protein
VRTHARRKKENRSHPVSRLLFARTALRRFRRNDHSSRPAVTRGLQRPTRWLRTGRPRAPPYLVLLRAGFCLPSVLPRTRCALTAPFHPYSPSSSGLRRSRPARRLRGLASPKRRRRGGGRYVFCATLRQVALPGRYPAHCPSEVGLSSPRLTSSRFARDKPHAGCVRRPKGLRLPASEPRRGESSSGRLADCDIQLSRTVHASAFSLLGSCSR